MRRIGVDLDGVAADFVEAFFRISNPMFGTAYTIQEDWDFTQYTKDQLDMVWTEIKGTKNFWQTLRPEVGTNSLRYPVKNRELVFITSRVPTLGHSAREQSCQWLRREFGITHPFVIVADKVDQKPAIVKALGIESFIDDKRSTIEEMNQLGIRSYARLQPYNCKQPFPEGVFPAESLDEFIEQELRFDQSGQ